ASDYAGTARATDFSEPGRKPSPGSRRIAGSAKERPGPVAIAAGTTIATAARKSSGTAAGRRTTVGSPNATTPNSTTAAITAKIVVREAGTASAFQMPPRLSRL